MRLANLTLLAASVSLIFCATAQALTPPPTDGPPGAPSGPPARTLTSTAVGAIPIGSTHVVGDPSRKIGVGTIAELEDLQRKTALAEARKRLQDLTPVAVPQKAPEPVIQPADGAPQVGIGAAGQQPAVAAGRQPLGLAKRTKGAASIVAPQIAPAVDDAASTHPSAKLVSIMVVGGRARADVLEDGRLTTIREGDKLGGWTVTRISSDGVVTEYIQTAVAPASSAATSFPAAYGTMAGVGRSDLSSTVRTFKLASASQAEISTVLGLPGVGGQPKVAGPVQNARPGPDSATVMAPVPPLPASLASR